MLPTWVYAKSAEGVYVNLFIGSTITLEGVAGTDVEMVQATDYPWGGKVAITVNPRVRKNFSVRIRVPNRGVSGLYRGAPGSDGVTSIAVNGSVVKAAIDKGYAVITRTWKAGDRIDVVLPLRVQRVRASDRIEADRNKVALRRGPIFYNIERVDQDITKVLAPESALSTEWRANLLGGVMVINGAFADGSPMLAIPHYARMNREPAQPAAAVADSRRSDGPPRSIVWINER
jgi:DUF1680 family protein